VQNMFLKTDIPKKYCGKNIGHTLYTAHKIIQSLFNYNLFAIIRMRKSTSL